jgi:hypothetical protein
MDDKIPIFWRKWVTLASFLVQSSSAFTDWMSWHYQFIPCPIKQPGVLDKTTFVTNRTSSALQIVTPCCLEGGYRRFGGSCCLHLQGWSNLQGWSVKTTQRWRWRKHVPAKHRYLPTRLHGVTIQKTTVRTITTMKTSKNAFIKRYITSGTPAAKVQLSFCVSATKWRCTGTWR